jgi:hypothetical protein
LLHSRRRNSLVDRNDSRLRPPSLLGPGPEQLAKLAQNPVGNLISLPFQNNTNFNFGPDKGTQNVLNIQRLAHRVRGPMLETARLFRGNQR